MTHEKLEDGGGLVAFPKMGWDPAPVGQLEDGKYMQQVEAQIHLFFLLSNTSGALQRLAGRLVCSVI